MFLFRRKDADICYFFSSAMLTSGDAASTLCNASESFFYLSVTHKNSYHRNYLLFRWELHKIYLKIHFTSCYARSNGGATVMGSGGNSENAITLPVIVPTRFFRSSISCKIISFPIVAKAGEE